ncbi:MAG: restriction endonuclease subunit S [Xanthobacteraceae bacterium]
MKDGWQTKTLDQISTNLDSRRVPITKGVRASGKYPYYGASGIVDYVADYIFDEDTLLISEDGANLLARSAPVAFPASGKYWVNNHAHILKFENTTTQRFVEWYFESIPLDDYITGAAQPKLNQKALNSIPIPVPSLPEQRRIVGVLDEAFAGIATAKTNAEKNLQNTRALLQSHLQTVFTQRGRGWMDRTLDQVCIVERGSSPRPIKEYFTTRADGVNWIKIGDTEEGGKYVYSTAQKITPEGARQSRFVKEGDFILTNSMSFGRPYIMKASGYIHDGWFVLRLNTAIDTDYFYYLLSSPVVQSQFASLASGSVVKNISGDLVKKAVLPIAPLEQQHVIVERLLGMSSEIDRLASIYEQKLAALEALKKSLLHEAFAGNL